MPSSIPAPRRQRHCRHPGHPHRARQGWDQSTPQQIVTAINAAAGLPFQAGPRPDRPAHGRAEPLAQLPADGLTAGGSGTAFDQNSGLQITNDGKTFTVSLSGDKTVGDLLNTIQQSGAGMLAQINAEQDGHRDPLAAERAEFHHRRERRQHRHAARGANPHCRHAAGRLELRQRRRPAAGRRRRLRFHHHPARPEHKPQRQPGGTDHGRPGLRLTSTGWPRPPARTSPPN